MDLVKESLRLVNVAESLDKTGPEKLEYVKEGLHAKISVDSLLTESDRKELRTYVENVIPSVIRGAILAAKGSVKLKKPSFFKFFSCVPTKPLTETIPIHVP